VKTYLVAERLLGAVLRVAMPRAVESPVCVPSVSPTPGTKNQPRAFANSSPWRLRGIGYL